MKQQILAQTVAGLISKYWEHKEFHDFDSHAWLSWSFNISHTWWRGNGKWPKLIIVESSLRQLRFMSTRDWCLAQWLILSTSVVRMWGRILLGQFLVTELNIQDPVKYFAPYLGGRWGWVPSDSLRKFLQEVNLYNLFNYFFRRMSTLYRNNCSFVW